MRPHVRVESQKPVACIEDYKVVCDIKIEPSGNVQVKDLVEHLEKYFAEEMRKYLDTPAVQSAAEFSNVLANYLADLVEKQNQLMYYIPYTYIPPPRKQADWDSMRQAFMAHTHYPAGAILTTGI